MSRLKGLDDWLAAPCEHQEEPEYDDCFDCDGAGLVARRQPDGSILLSSCPECDGYGTIEVDPDVARERAEQERLAAAADAAMERYYHDKYGD